MALSLAGLWRSLFATIFVVALAAPLPVSAQNAGPVVPLCNGTPCFTSGNPAAVTATISPSTIGGLSPVVSAALESNHVLKASAGNLYDFQANFITCASPPCWVMLFDATALPANGAVTPVKWWQVGQNQSLPITWAPGPPLKFATGITLGCSTSGPFTLTATAQCTFSGEVQ